jgi:hypothetical protein
MIAPGKHQDIASIAHEFFVACENIDPILFDFIYARFMAYRISRAKHDAARRDHRDAN